MNILGSGRIFCENVIKEFPNHPLRLWYGFSPLSCCYVQVQDMVAIRHSSSSDQHRTTLILLCEDGSLRIYMANVDQTGHWMASQFQATGSISALKPIRKKKVTKSGSSKSLPASRNRCEAGTE